ncbi:MAG: hypothetical protein VX495_05645 [Nitrospinota bacterium]|nr:hypothetical protein [Nitrospinota bacterium]
MGSDELFEKEYENLNDAILKAIVSSKDVQKILITLKEREEINDTAVLNLFLSLDELYEMISEKHNKNNSCPYKSESTESNTLNHKEDVSKKVDSPDNNENFIDGKPLTLNEILFENFCQEKFNEEIWKKKARISL